MHEKRPLARCGIGAFAKRDFVGVLALLAHAGVNMSELGIDEWNACRQLCLDKNLTADDVSDAFIAGSARILGAKLTTFDRGFERLLPPSDLELLVPDR